MGFLTSHASSMKKILSVVLLSTLLLGCSAKKDAINEGGQLSPGSAQVDKKDARNRYLAVTHALSVESDEDGVKVLYEKLIAACAADKEFSCTLLDSRFATGRDTSGFIKLRAKADGIQNFIRLAGSGGKITQQSTSTEDLARPIVDGAKRIEMLQQYEKKLIELEHRPNNDVDTLIKLSREIASTQADLEQAGGENAKLLERVNLDILTVSIDTVKSHSFSAPIRQAASSFGANFSEALASVITGLAYIVPWGIVLLFIGFLLRKLWRRKKT